MELWTTRSVARFLDIKRKISYFPYSQCDEWPLVTNNLLILFAFARIRPQGRLATVMQKESLRHLLHP